MSKHIKNLSALTALTLAVSPAYGEKNPGTHSSVNASVSEPAQPPESAAPSESVRIQAEDVDVKGPDLVVISSPDLAYGVTFHPKQTLRALAKISPVHLDDVTVDEDGRVVVRNADFAAHARDLEQIDINSGCNCHC